MGVCPTGDGSLTPFVAKYCTALGFDLDMARTMSAQEMICAMSEKLNKMVQYINCDSERYQELVEYINKVVKMFQDELEQDALSYFQSEDFENLLEAVLGGYTGVESGIYLGFITTQRADQDRDNGRLAFSQDCVNWTETSVECPTVCADPYLFEHEGTYYCLVSDYDLAANKVCAGFSTTDFAQFQTFDVIWNDIQQFDPTAVWAPSFASVNGTEYLVLTVRTGTSPGSTIYGDEITGQFTTVAVAASVSPAGITPTGSAITVIPYAGGSSYIDAELVQDGGTVWCVAKNVENNCVDILTGSSISNLSIHASNIFGLPYTEGASIVKAKGKTSIVAQHYQAYLGPQCSLYVETEDFSSFTNGRVMSYSTTQAVNSGDVYPRMQHFTPLYVEDLSIASVIQAAATVPELTEGIRYEWPAFELDARAQAMASNNMTLSPLPGLSFVLTSACSTIPGMDTLYRQDPLALIFTDPRSVTMRRQTGSVTLSMHRAGPIYIPNRQGVYYPNTQGVTQVNGTAVSGIQAKEYYQFSEGIGYVSVQGTSSAQIEANTTLITLSNQGSYSLMPLGCVAVDASNQAHQIQFEVSGGMFRNTTVIPSGCSVYAVFPVL